MPRTLREKAEFVIETVRSLGLEPNPSSRLAWMRQVLGRPEGVISPTDRDFEIALEAVRDIQVLEFVFDTLPADARQELEPKVAEVLRDSGLPQQDRRNSRGRDTQFELFVTAVCWNAGLLPVSSEEPDVTCTVDAVKFGIAAKRIKTIGKLERRVREAAGQVQKAGLPGVVVLDTCVALNRDNKRILNPIPDGEFGPLYKTAIDRFIRDHHHQIQLWVRGSGVRGIAIHDQQVRLKPDGGWSLVGMTEWISTARENQRRCREAAAFWQRYRKGLPDMEVL